jgi:PPIC-type PPIASE domain
MQTRFMARLALAFPLIAFLSAAGLAAQAAVPLPTRKPIVQVNLKANEPYYLETFKADIERLESGLNSISTQKIKIASKDKLNILLDTIDMILFRQYCDQEGIKVSDSDVANQMAQYRASIGPGATDAMVEASLRRSAPFYTDVKTYIKQELLFQAYLKAKKADDVKAISQPSASDVLKAYDEMKFNLRRPNTYRFTMITALTQGKSDADKKKAKDTMHAIADKLKVNPNGFDEYLVRGAVEPKSVGYQTMMNLVIAKTAESKKQYPALYEAIFNLKEGQVSDLIEENSGYIIVRAEALLPEKQLGFDDYIEGLTNSKPAQANPSATVLALVVNDLQSTKYAELHKTTRDAVNAKLRQEATITLTLANLAGMLDDPEIAALKALKSSGYNIVQQ